jgi:hypothetical protein
LKVISVAVQEEDAPETEGATLGVPVPRMVMPIPAGMTIPALQVHIPAGIWMISPSTAVCMGPFTSVFTSGWLHVAAVKVAEEEMDKEKGRGPAVPAEFEAVT